MYVQNQQFEAACRALVKAADKGRLVSLLSSAAFQEELKQQMPSPEAEDPSEAQAAVETALSLEESEEWFSVLVNALHLRDLGEEAKGDNAKAQVASSLKRAKVN